MPHKEAETLKKEIVDGVDGVVVTKPEQVRIIEEIGSTVLIKDTSVSQAEGIF